ncbi:MAG: TrmH family RNA methyltransferase [Caldilineaceae bacterium]
MQQVQIRQCSASSCRFRFPMTEDALPGDLCPKCGAMTDLIATRHVSYEAIPEIRSAIPDGFDVLLDNLRSLFNVGSIFRSAEGAGLHHLYLCGITPTPENPKLAKTSLGAEAVVGWSHHNNAIDLAHQLLRDGRRLWALDVDEKAQSLFAVEPPDSSVVLVVGNEVSGIDPDLHALCERTVCIPMAGMKRSLNVAVAFGIAAFGLRHQSLEIGE